MNIRYFFLYLCININYKKLYDFDFNFRNNLNHRYESKKNSFIHMENIIHPTSDYLFLLSTESKIQLNDYYIDDTGTLRRSVMVYDKQYWSVRMDYYKVLRYIKLNHNAPDIEGFKGNQTEIVFWRARIVLKSGESFFSKKFYDYDNELKRWETLLYNAIEPYISSFNVEMYNKTWIK